MSGLEDEIKEKVEEVVNDEVNGLIQVEVEVESEINVLNWLNLAAYIVNTVFTYAVGVGGILGKGTTNSDLSKKYQTLITPKGTAFAIWGIIFAFQGAFVVAQLLPKFRATKAVQKGVSFGYVAVCLFQTAWSFSFAKEVIWLALIFMTGIWVSLIFILFNQYNINSERSILDYFLLRFPFDIHAGWITVALLLNVNVLVVYYNKSERIQSIVATVSLAAFWAVSVFLLFALVKYANYTMAVVFIWAISFIAAEVDSPDNVKRLFWQKIVRVTFKYTSISLAVIIAIQIVARATIDIVNQYVNPRQVSTEIEEDDERRVPLMRDTEAV